MSTHITIAAYAEQAAWVRGFLEQDGLPLLFMVGHPGTGKSAAFKALLDGDLHFYTNTARLTAFQLYKTLYRVRNKAVILDDVDDALRRSDMARLLMALCETDDRARTVAWHGTETLLRVRKGNKVVRVPAEFTTTSRVAVICNDWSILTTKFGALLDRGTVVFFDPAADEVHRQAGTWFRDDEVYAFVGEHLGEIDRPSIRYYVNARTLKRLGLDWRAALLESWASDRVRRNANESLVEQLLADPAYPTEKDRVAAFAERTGLSRRTYFNLKEKLARAAR